MRWRNWEMSLNVWRRVRCSWKETRGLQVGGAVGLGVVLGGPCVTREVL